MSDLSDSKMSSTTFIDISFACAAHVEQSLVVSGPAKGKMQEIDDEIFVAGQMDDSVDALSEIQTRGIKSVFNIRLNNEEGYIDLSNQLNAVGIAYSHLPIDYSQPNVLDVDKLLGQLDVCPKPCLIFCQVGLRAAAMGIAFKTARRNAAKALGGSLGSSAVALMEPSDEQPVSLIDEADTKLLDDLSTDAGDSQLKDFVASYVAAKVRNCLKRPGASKICESCFVSGQISEAELQDFVREHGIRSVLNLREPREAGQFGLGMLPKEKEIVEGMGLKYVNVPVPREGEYSLELCKQVSDSLQSLLESGSPVLVHCRTGGRVKEILKKSTENGLLNESTCKPFAQVSAPAHGTMVVGGSMGVPVVTHASLAHSSLSNMQCYLPHTYPPQEVVPSPVVVVVHGEEEGVGVGMGRDPKAAAPSAAAELSWKSMVPTAVAMGLLFGVFMDLSKVTNPIVIREQFIFQRFLMLKIFLAAGGSSALFFAILSVLVPGRFAAARAAFFPSLENKGLATIVLGAMLLGAGMALAGACPGMVLIQCGGGVESGPVALAGGLTAAIVFGVLQPYLLPVMGAFNLSQEKAEDLKMLSAVAFWKMAAAFFVCCVAVIAIFEGLFPWDSAGKEPRQWIWTGELPSFAIAWTNTLPPWLCGIGIGLLQVPCVLFCGDTLGSSSAYMTVTSQVLVSKTMQEKLPHWSGFRLGLSNWWQAVYIIFAILGAFISSWSTKTFGLAKSVSEWEAFVGGFLMIFGSRIASGCTSGHGLSGMALLCLKSIIAVPAMFAGGCLVGFIYQAVDPRGYTGFAYLTTPALAPA